MYAGFFGLSQTPFSIAPDPHYLYLSERHREALAHLLYGVQGGGGFVLLTGEIGAGKTTVCRAFLEQMPAHCRVAYLFNPKLTVGELLRTICQEFHIEARPQAPGAATITDHIEPLNEYLLASHAQGLQNLLIIDEAQGLTPHVLEQLRLLTNLETAERKLLQIVLIGQPELRTLLAQPDLEQVSQRVIARFHLGALGEAETRQYIAHRMAVAGLRGALPFTDAALSRIQTLTRGVPRRINLLCDRALLGAYASDRRTVDVAVVDQAAREVFDDTPGTARPGAHPLRRRPWALLGLGAVFGALLAGVAAFALWQKPDDTSGTARAGIAPTTVTNTPATATPAGADPSPAAAVPATSSASASVVGPTGNNGGSAAAQAPSTAAVAAGDVPLSPEAPAREQLIASENAAWRELGLLWQQTLDHDAPCLQAQENGLQCFRTPRMTEHGLRQLNRPGVLTLQLVDGPARALLTRLDTDTATLQAGEHRWRLPLDRLASVWHGDYATLWRTPPGTTQRIGNVSTGPAVQWIGEQLRLLQAAGDLPAGPATFATRLQAFQLAQGIDGGGKATPMTFMQVNRLRGVDEPRLAAP